MCFHILIELGLTERGVEEVLIEMQLTVEWNTASFMMRGYSGNPDIPSPSGLATLDKL